MRDNTVVPKIAFTKNRFPSLKSAIINNGIFRSNVTVPILKLKK